MAMLHLFLQMSTAIAVETTQPMESRVDASQTVNGTTVAGAATNM